MKHIKPLDMMPLRVKAFGRLWAVKWMAENYGWASGEIEDDHWYQYENYDLNLWCEDGRLRVSAYATFKDEDGDTTTDCSEWVTIVDRGRNE